MTTTWTTQRGDEWWYSDASFEAEGMLVTVYPSRFEITIKNKNTKLSEKSLYEFLLITQTKFLDCQVWLTLNMEIKTLLRALKNKNQIDWDVIQHPFSESAKIRFISNSDRF